MAKKKATKKGAPQKLLARGKGAIKRTPLHLADPAAVGEQEYELEDIVDHGKSHGVERWCCKWVGWEHTANTWEPLANLAGCEQFIARYNKENETKLKALEVELEAKNKKKREDKEQAQEEAAKKLQAEPQSLYFLYYSLYYLYCNLYSLYCSLYSLYCNLYYLYCNLYSLY